MSSRPARAASTAARRAVVTLLGVATLALLSAGPALADNARLGPQENADLSSGLTGGETLLLLVGGPIAIVLLIAFVFGVGSLARTERYRPGKGWSAAPVWFAGPREPVAAVEAASQTRSAAVRGGASGDW